MKRLTRSRNRRTNGRLNIPGTTATVFNALKTRKVLRADKLPTSELNIVRYLEMERYLVNASKHYLLCFHVCKFNILLTHCRPYTYHNNFS